MGEGYSLWAVFGKSRGEWGTYEKSLPLVGYGYFLEPHNEYQDDSIGLAHLI